MKKLEDKIQVAESLSGLLSLVGMVFGALMFAGIVGMIVWNTEVQAWLMLISLIMMLLSMLLSSMFLTTAKNYQIELLEMKLENERMSL